MNDDTARLSIIWQVLRQRWRLLIVIAVLGALVGAGASLVFSPGYETSASVLLQGPRDPDELLTEAQVATQLGRARPGGGRAELGQVGRRPAGRRSPRRSPTATSSTSRRSRTPRSAAQQLADRVAQEYVTFSTQLMSEHRGRVGAGVAGAAADAAPADHRDQPEDLRPAQRGGSGQHDRQRRRAHRAGVAADRAVAGGLEARRARHRVRPGEDGRDGPGGTPDRPRPRRR